MGLYPTFVLCTVPFSLYLQPGLCAIESPASHQAHHILSNAHLCFFSALTLGWILNSLHLESPFHQSSHVVVWTLLKTFSNLLRQPTILVDAPNTADLHIAPASTCSLYHQSLLLVTFAASQSRFYFFHALLKDVLFLLTFFMTLLECHQCPYVSKQYKQFANFFPPTDIPIHLASLCLKI